MPRGKRADGGSRMTYSRAKEVEAAYLARVGRGGKVHQKAVEKEALAVLAKFKATEAKGVVEAALKGLKNGIETHRTQKRLDAFALTKTPLPDAWREPDKAPEVPRGVVAGISHPSTVALAGVIAKAIDDYMRTQR
jgi:hypothetical protein